MPTYSEKFVREERALPDWSARPVCREMFPPELLDTIEPGGGAGARKKRRLELSKVSALPNAEEAFGLPSLEDDDEEEGAGTGNGRNLLARLDALRDDEADDGGELDDEEGLEEGDEDDKDKEEEDEAYDDEDAGDYDAENYFDNGDEMGEDYGDDGDDGEGTY